MKNATSEDVDDCTIDEVFLLSRMTGSDLMPWHPPGHRRTPERCEALAAGSRRDTYVG
jgi:hypothetical protein